MYMLTEVRPENFTPSRSAEKDSFVTSVNIRRVVSLDDFIETALSICGVEIKLKSTTHQQKAACSPDALSKFNV